MFKSVIANHTVTHWEANAELDPQGNWINRPLWYSVVPYLFILPKLVVH